MRPNSAGSTFAVVRLHMEIFAGGIALIAASNPAAIFAVILTLYLISALLVLALPERGFREMPAAAESTLVGPSIG